MTKKGNPDFAHSAIARVVDTAAIKSRIGFRFAGRIVTCVQASVANPDHLPYAWIDGALVPANSPALPTLDQAFLSGMGAFETIRVEEGVPLFLEAHCSRLASSASLFGLVAPGVEALGAAIRATLECNALNAGRLRVTLSSSLSPDGVPFRFGAAARLTILAFPLPAQSDQGISVAIAPFPVNSKSPLSGHKCTSYALHGIAVHHARENRCDEALLLNELGQICSCATSNIFWISEGCVFTPDPSSGCRAGVTRERILAICDQLSIPCRTTHATVDALVSADEAFVSSSIRGIQCIHSINGNQFASGDLAEHIKREIAKDRAIYREQHDQKT